MSRALWDASLPSTHVASTARFLDDAGLALADGPVVVELVIDNVESTSLLTQVIGPGGAGDLYADGGIDFPLECLWRPCGLTKTTFDDGDLVDGDGGYMLRQTPGGEAIDVDLGDLCC